MTHARQRRRERRRDRAVSHALRRYHCQKRIEEELSRLLLHRPAPTVSERSVSILLYSPSRRPDMWAGSVSIEKLFACRDHLA